MKEIWENAAHSFAVFIARCMTDFPENEFYRKALNDYSRSARDEEILIGRLELLRKRKIGVNDDPAVLFEIIENEHELNRSYGSDQTVFSGGEYHRIISGIFCGGSGIFKGKIECSYC